MRAAMRTLEQDLEAICRQWGMTPEEVKGNHSLGRPAESKPSAGIVRLAIIATFIRDMEPSIRVRNGRGRHTAFELAAILGVDVRTVSRHLRAIRQCQDRKVWPTTQLAERDAKYKTEDQHAEM